MSDSSRQEILARVGAALEGRDRLPHPGPLEDTGPGGDPVDAFRERLLKSGGEMARCEDPGEAGAWLARLLEDSAAQPTPTVWTAHGLPAHLRPRLPGAEPEHADVGISMAEWGVAESGSVILAGTEGRAGQLLPPVHVVWLREDRVVSRLAEALELLEPTLPRSLALHSGPSKSADIGRIVVSGVHGPGRLIVALLPSGSTDREADRGDPPAPATPVDQPGMA